MLFHIIDSYQYSPNRGLPMGNQISQLFALYYLDPLDRFIKEKLQIKHYVRYMDEHLEEQNLLGWIELIENQKLYEAVKNLSIEDQIFISYIVKEGRTQREVARIYGIN